MNIKQGCHQRERGLAGTSLNQIIRGGEISVSPHALWGEAVSVLFQALSSILLCETLGKILILRRL